MGQEYSDLSKKKGHGNKYIQQSPYHISLTNKVTENSFSKRFWIFLRLLFFHHLWLKQRQRAGMIIQPHSHFFLDRVMIVNLLYAFEVFQ